MIFVSLLCDFFTKYLSRKALLIFGNGISITAGVHWRDFSTSLVGKGIDVALQDSSSHTECIVIKFKKPKETDAVKIEPNVWRLLVKQ